MPEEFTQKELANIAFTGLVYSVTKTAMSDDFEVEPL